MFIELVVVPLGGGTDPVVVIGRGESIVPIRLHMFLTANLLYFFVSSFDLAISAAATVAISSSVCCLLKPV
jgi:hypothetical protein